MAEGSKPGSHELIAQALGMRNAMAEKVMVEVERDVRLDRQKADAERVEITKLLEKYTGMIAFFSDFISLANQKKAWIPAAGLKGKDLLGEEQNYIQLEIEQTDLANEDGGNSSREFYLLPLGEDQSSLLQDFLSLPSTMKSNVLASGFYVEDSAGHRSNDILNENMPDYHKQERSREDEDIWNAKASGVTRQVYDFLEKGLHTIEVRKDFDGMEQEDMDQIRLFELTEDYSVVTEKISVGIPKNTDYRVK